MTLLDSVLDSSLFQTTAWAILFCFLIFDIALAWWAYRDVAMRTTDKRMHVLVTVLTLAFNVFGFVIYSLLRPVHTLAESEIEKLELSILQSELADLEGASKKTKKNV